MTTAKTPNVGAALADGLLACGAVGAAMCAAMCAANVMTYVLFGVTVY